MTFNPETHHRRSIRLKGYDYSSAGAYFITICTKNRRCILSEILNEKVVLNQFGMTVRDCWKDLSNHYGNVETDTYVIMPNHFHGIIFLKEIEAVAVGASLKLAPTRKYGLPEIVRGFKTFSARHINKLRNNPGQSVWQRNYYERIVRNDDELNRIREYILDNPLKWAYDRDNPENWK